MFSALVEMYNIEVKYAAHETFTSKTLHYFNVLVQTGRFPEMGELAKVIHKLLLATDLPRYKNLELTATFQYAELVSIAKVERPMYVSNEAAAMIDHEYRIYRTHD